MLFVAAWLRLAVRQFAAPTTRASFNQVLIAPALDKVLKRWRVADVSEN